MAAVTGLLSHRHHVREQRDKSATWETPATNEGLYLAAEISELFQI